MNRMEWEDLLGKEPSVQTDLEWTLFESERAYHGMKSDYDKRHDKWAHERDLLREKRDNCKTGTPGWCAGNELVDEHLKKRPSIDNEVLTMFLRKESDARTALKALYR